jgi:hypothetical protein
MYSSLFVPQAALVLAQVAAAAAAGEAVCRGEECQVVVRAACAGVSTSPVCWVDDVGEAVLFASPLRSVYQAVGVSPRLTVDVSGVSGALDRDLGGELAPGALEWIDTLWANDTGAAVAPTRVLSAMRRLRRLALRDNFIRDLTPWLAHTPNLLELDVARNGIQSLPPTLATDVPQLHVLKLLKNNLTSIDLSTLPPTVTHVYGGGNQVTRVHFSSPATASTSHLRELHLDSNDIESVSGATIRALRAMPSLRVLNLANNPAADGLPQETDPAALSVQSVLRFLETKSTTTSM